MACEKHTKLCSKPWGKCRAAAGNWSGEWQSGKCHRYALRHEDRQGRRTGRGPSALVCSLASPCCASQWMWLWSPVSRSVSPSFGYRMGKAPVCGPRGGPGRYLTPWSLLGLRAPRLWVQSSRQLLPWSSPYWETLLTYSTPPSSVPCPRKGGVW